MSGLTNLGNMAWTNEDTFKFIQLYQSKPIIWNPRNKKHTDRNLVEAAWNRIADEMNMPVPVLKRKKKTLMTTFRFHYKKKQFSLRRYKMGSKHIYTPIWTFYEALEAFLKGVYETKSGKKIKIKRSRRKAKADDDDSSEEKHQHQQNEISNDDNHTTPLQQRTSTLGLKEASREVSSAFQLLNRIFKEKQKNNEDKILDECELYGKLLAKKLRQFSENERLDIMYELDGLLMNRCIQQSDSLPLELNIKEPTNSASDSYPSRSQSPQNSHKARNTKKPKRHSLDSPQSDPLQSSSSHPSLQDGEV